MTDTAPDNACPVEQVDRDFVADWILIAPENCRRVRAGEWDHHEAVQAAARHRQRTLPPAAEAMEREQVVAKAAHENLSRQDVVAYLDTDFDLHWLARDILAAFTNLQTGGVSLNGKVEL
jgi:hypothetical protein